MTTIHDTMTFHSPLHSVAILRQNYMAAGTGSTLGNEWWTLLSVKRNFFAKFDLLDLFSNRFFNSNFNFLVFRIADGCTSDLERIHFVIKLLFSSHHAGGKRRREQGRCRGGENLFISSA